MFLKNSFFKKFLGEILNNKLLVLIFVLILAIIFFTFKDYGIGWDEKDAIDLGNNGFSYYFSLGKDKTFLTYYPQPEFYATRGPIIEVVRRFFSLFLNKNSMSFYHLFLALMAVPTFYFVYKIIFLITNHKLVSAISPLILLLMPRFWGDIFNNSKDIPVGMLVSIIIFLSLFILKKAIKIKPFLFILLGIVMGMAASLRIVVAYFLPLFAIYYFAILFNGNKKCFKKYFTNIFLTALFFLISIHVCSPYLQMKPLVGIIDMINDSKKFPWIGTMLFDGKFVQSTALPWYYLPKWMLITTPLYILFFSTVSLLGFFLKNTKNNFLKLANSFILISFGLPIILTIFMKPIIYDAWRHFLFLSVPLILLASLGIFYLLIFFEKKAFISILIYMLILIGLINTAFSYAKLHPYEYSYFNFLVGGLNGAYVKYETDYWGKSFKESIEWLDENTPNDRKIFVKTCGHPFSSTYYFKDNLELTDKINMADYYVCYTRNNEHLLVSNNKTVYVIEREGVSLNYVKKIK